MRPKLILGWLAAALFVASPAAPAASCSATSGPQRATLIELFTSEGCSSCPPADRWLSGFASGQQAAAQVVPLAFHVDYWDYIGWADRFASPAYTARQKARMASSHGRFIYTPQTVVDGQDSNAWRQAGGPGRLPASPAATTGAEISLQVEPAADGQRSVHLAAHLLPSASRDGPDTVAYLALYENGLSSEVRRGENAGQQLRHDFVVRQWLGPFPFDATGQLNTRQLVKTTGIDPKHSGVAAIVESRDGSHYLQALHLPLCP